MPWRSTRFTSACPLSLALLFPFIVGLSTASPHYSAHRRTLQFHISSKPPDSFSCRRLSPLSRSLLCLWVSTGASVGRRDGFRKEHANPSVLARVRIHKTWSSRMYTGTWLSTRPLLPDDHTLWWLCMEADPLVWCCCGSHSLVVLLP